MNTIRRASLIAAMLFVLGCEGHVAADLGHDATVGWVPTDAVAGRDSVPVAVHEFGDAAGAPTVLLFLHGVGGSEMTWEEIGGTQAVANLGPAAGLRLIVAAPRGDSLGWPELRDGSTSWERFLVADLLGYLRSEYRSDLGRRAVGISGVSAGGVTALALAFRRPDVFGCVTAHSPAIHPADPNDLPAWARGWEGWAAEYGSPIDTALWRARNPIALARASPAGLSTLGIYFDAGAEDHLGFQRTSGLLSAALAAGGVAHEFAVRPGGHGNAYNRSVLPYSLRFHLRCFVR